MEQKLFFTYPKLNLTFIASLILLCLGLFYQVPPLKRFLFFFDKFL